MIPVPRKMKTTLPVQELLHVENWWDKLSRENQKELKSLYLEDLPHKRQFVSIYLCGKYVEQEIDDPQNKFWIDHYYEYLVNHEIIIDEKQYHVGGTCSATKTAENALRSGIIKKDFTCPHNDDSHCLMKQLLSYKQHTKDFQFYVRFELEK